MPIKLGTPPVMNLVAIDTGSTLTWVQCQPCQPHCHDQALKAGQIFDPSKSTTFRRASCTSTECSTIKNALRLEFANCMEKEDTCLYSISYGGGWAYSAGKLVWDSVTIGNEQDTAINFSLLFGCSLDVQYSDKEAGIVGFGTDSFSFFEQVSKSVNYKAFSYCLPTEETEKGYMILGDYRRQGVDGYTPLFPSRLKPTYSLIVAGLLANGESLVSTASEMIVDSGSFWTILSPDTFSRLDDVITEAMAPLNLTRLGSRGKSYICFTAFDNDYVFYGKHKVFSDWSILPTMEMAFAGRTVRLRLQSKSLFHNDLKYGLCMNFMKADKGMVQLLGNRLTRSIETIFDIQGKRFGFRYAAC